ncbi:MAG TPA: hypothetical protein VD948_11690 [Rhodothermales bacterium]|nr:hypothetical protein [Rhodothermales bacterium]
MRLLSAFALLLAACSAGEPDDLGPERPDDVGQVRTDAPGYVAYTIGNAPLVLAAPHDGDLLPTTLRDRTCAACVTATDLHTQALAQAVADSFAAAHGCRPHLVVSRLHRRKLDPNRDLPEASDGDAGAEAAWRAYHTFLDTARTRIERQFGRGLFVDVHGHGHTIPRVELGYLLSTTTLRGSDAGLNAPAAVAASSLRVLIQQNRGGTSHANLLRGPVSLGALLAARGYRAVPSPDEPAPNAGEAYFDGGYSTARHGSRDGGRVDGVQAEMPFPGVRDTPDARARYAGALARSLGTFLRTHYFGALPAPCR